VGDDVVVTGAMEGTIYGGVADSSEDDSGAADSNRFG